MIVFIDQPEKMGAAGNVPKQKEEFFGRVRSQSREASIARMKSPTGREEPGQRPFFDEYTVALSGKLKVTTEKKEYLVGSGQAILVGKGE